MFVTGLPLGASPPPNTSPFTLAVSRTGAGTGTVTSGPPGVDCGADSIEEYDAGTAVTLTATPAPGSVFVGWDGNCTGVSRTCTVSMDSAASAIAHFAPDPGPLLLSVGITGSGKGTVTSEPAGVDCGRDCTEPYPYGTFVTLTAQPAGGSRFVSWLGDCTTTTATTCTVYMDNAASVTARFDK